MKKERTPFSPHDMLLNHIVHVWRNETKSVAQCFIDLHAQKKKNNPSGGKGFNLII